MRNLVVALGDGTEDEFSDCDGEADGLPISAEIDSHGNLLITQDEDGVLCAAYAPGWWLMAALEDDE